jgi:hypothetical protein
MSFTMVLLLTGDNLAFLDRRNMELMVTLLLGRTAVLPVESDVVVILMVPSPRSTAG